MFPGINKEDEIKTFMLIGQCYVKIKKQKEALKYFNNALELNKQYFGLENTYYYILV